jgi:hypothetical protein
MIPRLTGTQGFPPPGPPVVFLKPQRALAAFVNAPDSTSVPEPRPLSERVRGSLHQAIAGVYRNEPDADGALRDALRDAAVEAHQRALRPEELIIALKALLEDIPGGHGAAAAEQLRIRDRIVSACITAYFRNR